MSKQTSLTLESVSTLLRLDPETGQLYWLKKRGRIGSDLRAGCDLRRKDKKTGEVKFVGRVITIAGARYREGRILHLMHTGEWLETRQRAPKASPSDAFTGTPVEAPADAIAVMAEEILARPAAPVLTFQAKRAPVAPPKPSSFISSFFKKAA